MDFYPSIIHNSKKKKKEMSTSGDDLVIITQPQTAMQLLKIMLLINFIGIGIYS